LEKEFAQEFLPSKLCSNIAGLQKLVSREPIIAASSFQKRSQLFIHTHNETLSIVAMCVSNPDRSPRRIKSRYVTPTPTGFAEIVSDDFPRSRQIIFSLREHLVPLK
jgi:hypothetical protein